MSTVLENHLRTASPDDWIDVVLEVADPASAPEQEAERSERIARAEQEFTSQHQHVIQGIQNAGGEVLDQSWLSRAIKARIRVNEIDRLLLLDRVELIDLPRRLTRS